MPDDIDADEWRPPIKADAMSISSDVPGLHGLPNLLDALDIDCIAAR